MKRSTIPARFAVLRPGLLAAAVLAMVLSAHPARADDLSVSVGCRAQLVHGGSPPETVVFAGEPWLCDVTVANVGGTSATDITLTDTVPAGLTFTSTTVATEANSGGSPAVCAPLPSQGPSAVACGGIDVPAGGAVTFQMAFAVSPDFVAANACGELPVANTICITNFNGFVDSDGSNDCRTETDLVRDFADLRVTKVSQPATTVPAGQNFSYTVQVENFGPSYARSVRFSDQSFTTQGTPSAPKFQVVTVLDDPSRTDSCVIIPGFGTLTQQSLINCTLISPTLEPIGNPVSPAPVPNTGRWTVQIVMKATEGMDIANQVQAFTQGTAPNTPTCATGTPDLDVADNAVADAITVTAVADLQAFSVFGAEVQTNGLPGTSIDTNVLPPMPDPACCNFGGTTVTAGRRIQWDTSALNAGPSAARNVEIEVLLPAGTQVIENTLNGLPSVGNVPGRCRTEPAGAQRARVICQYGTVAAPDPTAVPPPPTIAALRFQVLVDPALPPGTQLSFDSVSRSETPDGNLANNVTTIQFDSNAWADQAAAIVDVPPAQTWSAGEVHPLEVRVTNAGPSLAQDAVLTTQLPPEVTFVGATAILPGQVGTLPLACELDDASRLSCPLGNLGVAALPVLGTTPLRVFLDVRVDPGTAAATVLHTQASVAAGTRDPLAGNNADTEDVTVDGDGPAGTADLGIGLTVAPAELTPGEPVVYTIQVANHGPAHAENVQVVDELPGAVIPTEVGLGGAPGSCLVAAKITCALGGLGAGQTRSLEVRGVVDSRLPGNVWATNGASVASDTPDAKLENNFASAIALVEVPPPPLSSILDVQASGASFSTGQTVIVTVTLTPGFILVPVDAYVVVRLPDGSLVSLTPGGARGGLVPFAQGFTPVAGTAEVLRYTFTGAEPPGAYSVFAGLTRPGTLDLIGGLTQAPFTFSP